jgi:hypothetical protein
MSLSSPTQLTGKNPACSNAMPCRSP